MDVMKTIITVLFMFHALLKGQMALSLEDSSNYIKQKKIEINRKKERARILMDEFVREAEAACQADIDECSIGSHDCHQNGTCINTPGHFNCSCQPGFTGNGRQCYDIDECGNGSHDCHQNAICTNTAGLYNCSCLPGYIGDGSQCRGKKGSFPSLPGLSCKDIKDSGEFNISGTYWIRPAGSSDSFQGYCDMSAVGQWKKVIAQASTFLGGVRLTYSDENNGLAIYGQATSYGCGGKQSGALTLIEGYWRKIKYTQEFRGVASCWSIFGDNWYGGDSVNNHPTGLHPFNASEGDSINNEYYMGGDSHSFDGNPRRCDNERTNFWDNPDRYVRYATVVLRRNLTEQKAGIFTGTSCGKPTYRIKDIFVHF